MRSWAKHIELREESGKVKAYRVSDGLQIFIPALPSRIEQLKDWLNYMSIDALEASRQFYQDQWNWDDDSSDINAIIESLEDEIQNRLMPRPMQQDRTTLDFTHIRQRQDRRNG